MSKKIYDSRAFVDNETDESLKKAFVNNLLVYNHCLGLLYKDPNMTFQTLRKYAIKYVEANNLYPVVIKALYNEIYYQYKKFRRNMRLQKTLSNVQYFTFIINSYDNLVFKVNSNRTEITLVEIPGTIRLEEPLPELTETGKVIYVNLSYSTMENGYRVNMYTSG